MSELTLKSKYEFHESLYNFIAGLPIIVISVGIEKVTFVDHAVSKNIMLRGQNFHFEKRLNYIQSSSASLVIITSTVSTTYNDIS